MKFTSTSVMETYAERVSRESACSWTKQCHSPKEFMMTSADCCLHKLYFSSLDCRAHGDSQQMLLHSCVF
eukprot:2767883-Amphidinium_carterae.1